MRNWRLWRYSRPLLFAGIIAVSGTSTTFAVTSSSDTYQVSETQFGGGSMLNSCSGQYCARASIGSMSNTKGAVAGGTVNFSPLNGEEPRIEVIVEPGDSNLGNLSAEQTATKTTIVRVSNYLTGGYQLQIVGGNPKFNNHSLAAPNSPAVSLPGTEQFGINVVANTDPTVGANAVQVPADSATFGVVDDDYDTPNRFMFSSGDVVARSQAESGRTDYTISMIVNISNTTPAGHYAGDFSAVVIPAF